MSLSRSEGESYAKSQVGSTTEEGSELDRRAELRRQWATLREEWSDFLSQRQSEQDAFVEKLLQQVPLSISSGIETRNSSELPSISKAFLSPARISHLSSSTPEMTVLPSSRQALPNPTFRSEKMLMSDADLAAEAECRMKQFVEEEESMTVSRKTSVRRSSRNHSSISEDDDKLHSVREFAERTSALENLVSTMRSNKRLHHWFNRLPCGKRFLRYFVNSLDYLNSLEEPERRGCCHCILQSTWFCSFCTLTILANVGVILYSANWTMENETFSVPSVVTALDIFFCCVYFVESGLKLIVHRAYFFWNEDAGWNVFDLCLVVLAVYDQAMFFVWQSEEADMYNANMNFMRSLRIVKVSRILRLVRVIRIFRDLRCMLFSILWSFIPLFWCLVLIFFVILVFSLFLIQLATEFVIQANWTDLPWGFKDEFLDYFGSVQQTMATLYMSSTGGVDWRVPYEVLAASGDLSCAAFLAYIAFFEFAVFNVLTGVFVDHAMKVSAADRELALAEQKKKERTEAERLRDTCRLIDADGDGKISWPEFHAFLAYENGYRNMASLGLDIFDSKKFFKNLMIMTNQREIEITQFVSGCMRMKGGATGIDLHSLYSELTSLHRRQEELQTSLTLALRLLQDKSIRKRSKLGSKSQEEEPYKEPYNAARNNLSDGSHGSLFFAPRDPYSVAPEGSPNEALSLRPVRAGALLRASTGLSLEGGLPVSPISFLLNQDEGVSTKLRM